MIVRIAIAVALVFGILLPFALSVGQSQSKNPPMTSNRVLKADVNLVLVTVTVTDNRNRFVQDLPKDRFRVWEDKVEQDVAHFSAEDTPVTLGIILDKSGSMGGRKPSVSNPLNPSVESALDEARSKAYSCLRDSLRDDEYFLIEFSEKPMVVADFTSDISKLKDKLLFANAGGRTALWDAIYAGITKAEQGTKTRKALVVLSDGGENRSRYTLGELKGLLRESEVRIYSFDRQIVQFSEMGQLSSMSGGRVFLSSNPCQELSADLKNQYVIGYTSTNRATDGAWRAIRVRVNTNGFPKELSSLTVRARAGYFAPSSGSEEAGR